MNLSEVTLGTPKVLDTCLNLFSQSEAENTPLPKVTGAQSTPAKYASHPDIQFFNAVKTKNHFAYHASKRATVVESSPGPIQQKNASDFDPFSRTLLLQRLRSYTALNWSIPYFKQDERQLTELFCSAHGWKCETTSSVNIQKNFLRCTGCNRSVVLRFNALDQQPSYAPCFFDVDDIQDLNIRLKDSYLDQIRLSAHSLSCPWRLFPCPVNDTYYLTPHIESTDDTLISGYLALLHKLYGNLAIAKHYEHTLSALAPQQGLSEFIRVSNSWLLNRYFKDSQENFGPLLEKTFPPWAYVLSAMGWDLHVQTFGTTAVPLLICTMCNQRIFLEPSDPGKNPPLQNISNVPGSTSESGPVPKISGCEFGEDMDCDGEENACHKPWCVLVSNFGDTPFFTYFHEMLVRSEVNIGPDGRYEHTSEKFSERDAEIPLPTRKRSLDIMANLERFSKLRRLYFSESDS